MFQRNLNDSGRLWRLCGGILVLLFAVWSDSWLGLLLAFFIFFEAFKGWCVVYSLLGKNSCPVEKKTKDNASSRNLDKK